MNRFERHPVMHSYTCNLRVFQLASMCASLSPRFNVNSLLTSGDRDPSCPCNRPVIRFLYIVLQKSALLFTEVLRHYFQHTRQASTQASPKVAGFSSLWGTV